MLAAVAVKAVEEFARDKVEDDEIAGLGTKISRFLPMLSKMLADRARKLSDRADQAILDTLVSAGAINIYIDDIDRGWTASENDIRNISALLNAVRDISGSDQRIRFRIGLRSDVYFLVRTSDETTDKIERHVVWLNWSNHEILCVIAKRSRLSSGRNWIKTR